MVVQVVVMLYHCLAIFAGLIPWMATHNECLCGVLMYDVIEQHLQFLHDAPWLKQHLSDAPSTPKAVAIMLAEGLSCKSCNIDTRSAGAL